MVELAAVDGIGGSRRYHARSYVLNLAGLAFFTDADHADHIIHTGNVGIIGSGKGVMAAACRGVYAFGCRFIAQYHRVIDGFGYTVAQYKSIVAVYGVVVTHGISVVAVDNRRVADGTGVSAVHNIARTDGDGIFVVGLRTGTDGHGVFTGCLSTLLLGLAVFIRRSVGIAQCHCTLAAGRCLITDSRCVSTRSTGVFRIAALGNRFHFAVVGVEELDTLLVHLADGLNHVVGYISILPFNVISGQRILVAALVGGYRHFLVGFYRCGLRTVGLRNHGGYRACGYGAAVRSGAARCVFHIDGGIVTAQYLISLIQLAAVYRVFAGGGNFTVGHVGYFFACRIQAVGTQARPVGNADTVAVDGGVAANRYAVCFQVFCRRNLIGRAAVGIGGFIDHNIIALNHGHFVYRNGLVDGFNGIFNRSRTRTADIAHLNRAVGIHRCIAAENPGNGSGRAVELAAVYCIGAGGIDAAFAYIGNFMAVGIDTLGGNIGLAADIHAFAVEYDLIVALTRSNAVEIHVIGGSQRVSGAAVIIGAFFNGQVALGGHFAAGGSLHRIQLGFVHGIGGFFACFHAGDFFAARIDTLVSYLDIARLEAV